MPLDYVLYKSPISPETLKIVRYLHSQGIDARPSSIVERNHPPQAIELPSIYDKNANEWHVGLARCCEYYQSATGASNVLEGATAFAESGEYRING